MKTQNNELSSDEILKAEWHGQGKFFKNFFVASMRLIFVRLKMFLLILVYAQRGTFRADDFTNYDEMEEIVAPVAQSNGDTLLRCA